jgi:hypothetical protein
MSWDVQTIEGGRRPGNWADPYPQRASREEAGVNDFLVAAIVFACVFGDALLGMFLGWILPQKHLSPESRDVIRIVMAMLATQSAVVLGLLTGSAITSLAE